MYCAYVTTINELHKHSNADRLQCATVFGSNVIVDLSYHLGQKVVYFPVDGQLSEEFASDNHLIKQYVPVSELTEEQKANKTVVNKNGVDMINIGGYMDGEKRNITALKLRGEKSDGLVLPIETLSKYVDVSKLKDGDQITVLNGHEICRKFIPQAKNSDAKPHNKPKNQKKQKKHGEPSITFPFFAKHSDTAQLAYNQSAFKPGDTCYITLKMHGTSGRTANTYEVIQKKRPSWVKKMFKTGDKVTKKTNYVSGSRRKVLDDFDDGYYGSEKFRQKYHDFFKDKLPKGVEVFYEIVGYVQDNQTIMGRCSNKLVKDKQFSKQYGNETVFSYGCNVGENECYVYRMTTTNEDGFVVEIPWEQVQVECERMGVKTVPLLDKFIFTTWEDLMERVEKYYDGPDPIGKTHIREGVVVRIDNRSTFTAYKHKNFYFKVLEGIIKDQSDAPDMEEAEELLAEN